MPVPAGFDLSSPRAQELWKHYTSSRPADEWLSAEAATVARLVHTDLEIERLTECLEDEGDLVTSSKGDLRPHPYVAMREQLFRRRVPLSRVLGMTTPSAIRDNDRTRALKTDKTARAIDPDSDDDELLATVDHDSPIHVTGPGDGEYATQFPPDYAMSWQIQLAALSAIGPLGATDDPVSLIKSGDTQRYVKVAHLSTPDLERAKQFDGPPTQIVITALAVKHLLDALGPNGLRVMAKTVLSMSNQRDEPYHLTDFVPHSLATRAVARAETELNGLLNPPKPRATRHQWALLHYPVLRRDCRLPR